MVLVEGIELPLCVQMGIHGFLCIQLTDGRERNFHTQLQLPVGIEKVRSPHFRSSILLPHQSICSEILEI